MTATLPLLVALLAPPAAQADAQTMQYFVSGRQKEVLDKEQQRTRERELKDRRSLEEKNLQALGRALEKQHGRTRDKWAEADRQRYAEAERTFSAASLAYEMNEVSQKDIDDSVADLKRSFQKVAERDGKGRIRLLDSRDQASVAVEVLARASTTRAVVLYLKVTPLRWLPADKLAALSFRRGAEGSGYESVMVPEQEYTTGTPYWIVSVWEFISGGGRWPGVADTSSELLAEVALGHLDSFRHRDPKPPAQ